MEPVEAAGPPAGSVPPGCRGVERPDGARGGWVEENQLSSEGLPPAAEAPLPAPEAPLPAPWSRASSAWAVPCPYWPPIPPENAEEAMELPAVEDAPAPE